MVFVNSFYLSFLHSLRLSHAEKKVTSSFISWAWSRKKSQPFSESYLFRRQREVGARRLAFLAWGDFHARSRFVLSTIPEQKLGLLVVYLFRWIKTMWGRKSGRDIKLKSQKMITLNIFLLSLPRPPPPTSPLAVLRANRKRAGKRAKLETWLDYKDRRWLLLGIIGIYI